MAAADGGIKGVIAHGQRQGESERDERSEGEQVKVHTIL